MKINKILSLIGVFLVSLIVTVSCSSTQPASNITNTAATATPVQMGYSGWPGWYPWAVANEQNLFAKNNVQVNLRWFDGYLDSMNAMNAGQLDANCQTLDQTISSAANGSDQVVVLVNDNSTGNDKVIVREGINSIAELKGKKVAAEEGTVDHFLLLLGMKEAGITQADIEFFPLETGAAAAAFAAGRVDAVAVYAPFTTKALERPGSKELFSSKDFPGAIPDHLVVSRKMINERPQEVQALVNTWFDTLDFIQKNQAKSLEIMAQKAGVSVADYKTYDAGTTLFSVEQNLQAFQPRNDMQSLHYAAKEINKFLLEADLIKRIPDLNRIFDDRFVKAYAASRKGRV
ncbi:ABC transporter substrate-binding protein [Chroogloeocystis siderophila]|uniref:Sulfonate ABC transporter substrate-binding protein n=1 Tax=Chroogloeocystis siderophila 5.2 s.c.1 TaxID=247279 RepID=A0A1U7HNA3_9CHRO|nr:ABC transporter substrate-binding protein [Chroogloeocystis siderophila]OKH24995.1 sulfonate ABC transporter substrate-binding protein [Chroogloeocystis siderophila 5.2 s.c.1]